MIVYQTIDCTSSERWWTKMLCKYTMECLLKWCRMSARTVDKQKQCSKSVNESRKRKKRITDNRTNIVWTLLNPLKENKQTICLKMATMEETTKTTKIKRENKMKMQRDNEIERWKRKKLKQWSVVSLKRQRL